MIFERRCRAAGAGFRQIATRHVMSARAPRPIGTTSRGLLDIVIRRGKRLSEALRVIEERARHQCGSRQQIEACVIARMTSISALTLRFGSGRAKHGALVVSF